MVAEQITRRGVRDPAVLAAMAGVPRHRFVPEELRAKAYDDVPLPIGAGQTISQPYIVAFMSEAIRARPTDRVLEIGTGSGYQTAILARLVARVFTIECRGDLAETARRRLEAEGIGNVVYRTGDGTRGWPEEAPFDAVLVAAAAGEIPPPLLEQLGEGGRLVLPVGGEEQELIRVTRAGSERPREPLLSVRFVPLIGWAPRRD